MSTNDPQADRILRAWIRRQTGPILYPWQEAVIRRVYDEEIAELIIDYARVAGHSIVIHSTLIEKAQELDLAEEYLRVWQEVAEGVLRAMKSVHADMVAAYLKISAHLVAFAQAEQRARQNNQGPIYPHRPPRVLTHLASPDLVNLEHRYPNALPPRYHFGGQN